MNWTEPTRFSLWRTDQCGNRASPLIIGWRVRERSHVVTDAVALCLL